jgi:hypothetical protein
MTEQLQYAIDEIEKLSSEDQDAIAARLLAEIKDDRAWEDRFRSTTVEQWERLAAMARRDSSAGQALSLDELFPPEGV